MTVTPQTNTNLQEIAKIINDHKTFVLSGHINPDGDCLGSQLALMYALRALGKQADVLLANDAVLNTGLKTIPGISELIYAEEYTATPEVFIACDVPNEERLGFSAAVKNRCAVSVTIDHHASETTMSRYNYVDPDAPATALLIWKLISFLDLVPDERIAECAYTGLMTDTGRFQYQNTTRECFEVAADMMNYGLKPDVVSANIFQNNSLASLYLNERMISRAQIDLEQGLAISYILAKDFDDLGAIKADGDILVDTLRSIAGIRVAVILREQGDIVRGSLRAKDETDVASVARMFNGGGHRAAAGLSYDGPIEQAMEDISKALIEAMDKSKGSK